MTFDFFLTILANIINFVIIFSYFLFLVIVKMLPQVLQCIRSADRVDQYWLISILIWAPGCQHRLVSKLLSTKTGCRPLWIGSALHHLLLG
jgi:hypothetical protein